MQYNIGTKLKFCVDVMSRLLSHIKIPLKKADPVFQLVMRFTFIILTNGYMTTQYTSLSPTIFDDETKSYIDIKKGITINKIALIY